MGYISRGEIAKELGVSPQAVGKRLRTTGLIARCLMSGRKIMIPEDVALELQAYYHPQTETKETNETETKTEKICIEGAAAEVVETKETNETETKETNETVGKFVPWEVYEELRHQLAVKDSQIENLNQALLNAQEQAKAAQFLQAADKQQALIEGGQIVAKEYPKSEPKRGLARIMEVFKINPK
jgi:DNA-binding Lrp family transcriptional regulator